MSEGTRRKIRKVNRMTRAEVISKLAHLDACNDKLSTYRRCIEARLRELDAR